MWYNTFPATWFWRDQLIYHSVIIRRGEIPKTASWGSNDQVYAFRLRVDQIYIVLSHFRNIFSPLNHIPHLLHAKIYVYKFYMREYKRNGCVNTRVHPCIWQAFTRTRIYWRCKCEVFKYVQLIFLMRHPWWAKDLVYTLFHFLCKTHYRFRWTWQLNLDSTEDKIAIIIHHFYLLHQLIVDAFWIVIHVLMAIMVVIFEIVSRCADASNRKYNRGIAIYEGYVFIRLSN